MVGLVIVSHSRALADGLIGLVRQVSPVSVPVAVAAGVGEARQEFGTDAVEIMSAIQAVYSEDGVVVLAGSVRSRAEQLLAERVAQSVSGVKKVTNDLKVAVSTSRQ